MEFPLIILWGYKHNKLTCDLSVKSIDVVAGTVSWSCNRLTIWHLKQSLKKHGYKYLSVGTYLLIFACSFWTGINQSQKQKQK